jgi:hypothetical protein
MAFQNSASLRCFSLNENQRAGQESAFMFGSGKPVPMAKFHIQEVFTETIPHKLEAVHPTAAVQSSKFNYASNTNSSNLKVTAIPKPSILIKEVLNICDEQPTAVKRHKTHESNNTKSAVGPVLSKSAKSNHQSSALTGRLANSVEQILVEAGACWATFASYMTTQADSVSILQSLQVAQLKQIMKMNSKGSKVSGTKVELIERIVELLKAR